MKKLVQLKFVQLLLLNRMKGKMIKKSCCSRFYYINSFSSNNFGPNSKTCICKVRAAWGRVSRGLTVTGREVKSRFKRNAQCSRMHLWQNFFFGLHAYFWKIQVILWCRNPFLEFFYYIDYGFLASNFCHFFLPFCNFYYWKVTNLALIEKKELCRQVWDLF